MRILIFFLLLSPTMVKASLIGGSGNFGEELLFALLLAGFFCLIALWIKFSKGMRSLKPLEVLPDFAPQESGFASGDLQLIPAADSKKEGAFESLWKLTTSKSYHIGKIGFLYTDLQEKTVQLNFSIDPEFAESEHIGPLIEQALAYVKSEWEVDIEVFQAYIEESDLLGEALLENLGFVETDQEEEILEFSLFSK